MRKKKKDLEDKILICVSVALITFLVFSLSFFLVFIDRGFYDKTFSAYGTYEKLGVEGVRSTADSLIKYLLSDIPHIENITSLEIFTPIEQSHLEDVHKIFQIVKYASLISILILFAIIARLYFKKALKRDSLKILKYSAISVFIKLIIIFFITINFEWFFNLFHKVLFPKGNYIFPSDYLLIVLFPQNFFEDFISKMLMHILTISIILFLLGMLGGKKRTKTTFLRK